MMDVERGVAPDIENLVEWIRTRRNRREGRERLGPDADTRWAIGAEIEGNIYGALEPVFEKHLYGRFDRNTLFHIEQESNQAVRKLIDNDEDLASYPGIVDILSVRAQTCRHDKRQVHVTRRGIGLPCGCGVIRELRPDGIW